MLKQELRTQVEAAITDFITEGVVYIHDDGSGKQETMPSFRADGGRLVICTRYGTDHAAPGQPEPVPPDPQWPVEWLPPEAWQIEQERREAVRVAERAVADEAAALEAAEAARRAATPDIALLCERYKSIIRPVMSEDDLARRFMDVEDGTAKKAKWLIDNVLEEHSNLVLVGDDKATKSTEMHELLTTFTTATPHWGLAPFYYNGDPLRVLLVQEENDRSTVEQDLLDIAHARGVEPVTDITQRRIISKAGFNLLDMKTRAYLCYLAEDYDVLMLDSLDKMGVPGTDASGELSDTLRFLMQLQTQLGTKVVISWPFASRVRFDYDSAHGGDILPRWWQGGMLLSWDDRAKSRHVKVCALRSRLGRHEFRFQGHGMGQWELKASANEGERLQTQASIAADSKKTKAIKMRAAGTPVKDIAEELDITERQVYRYTSTKEES